MKPNPPWVDKAAYVVGTIIASFLALVAILVIISVPIAIYVWIFR